MNCRVDDELSSKRDRALSVWGRPIYSTAHHRANEWEPGGKGGRSLDIRQKQIKKQKNDGKGGGPNFFFQFPLFALHHFLRKEAKTRLLHYVILK